MRSIGQEAHSRRLFPTVTNGGSGHLIQKNGRLILVYEVTWGLGYKIVMAFFNSVGNKIMAIRPDTFSQRFQTVVFADIVTRPRQRRASDELQAH